MDAGQDVDRAVFEGRQNMYFQVGAVSALRHSLANCSISPNKLRAKQKKLLKRGVF